MNNMQKEIQIPVPNTKFTIRGIRQIDNSWNLILIAPDTGKKRKIIDNVSPSILSIYSSLALNVPLKLKN